MTTSFSRILLPFFSLSVRLIFFAFIFLSNFFFLCNLSFHFISFRVVSCCQPLLGNFFAMFSLWVLHGTWSCSLFRFSPCLFSVSLFLVHISLVYRVDLATRISFPLCVCLAMSCALQKKKFLFRLVFVSIGKQ